MSSPTAPARLVVLASGSGSNLQAVIDACTTGQLAAHVVHVVVNRPDAGALDRAAAAGIQATTLACADQNRATYDAALADLVEICRPDVIVLAGWMRILTMNFLGRFPGRVVNLHPALPGEYPGTHAIERAFVDSRAGQRDHTGVMVHLVPDEGVDDGPVLATATVAIAATDTLESLTARVHAVEHRLLVDTLRSLIAELAPNPIQNGDRHARQSR